MRYAVIMAGGAGTRLWPAARRQEPKQVQRLIFERPLIAETVDRLQATYELPQILIVTAARYANAIREIVPELPAENIISEPVGKNTAAAIALAAFHIARRDPEGVFLACPADHVILDPEAFHRALAYGHELALHHRVVDIGVPPTHPETGYGYIELGDEIGKHDGLAAYSVRRFVEKPDLAHARQYVESGRYMWNSGMFIWRCSAFLDALREHLPDTFSRLAPAASNGDAAQLADAYAQLASISVDYAIMEKTSDVVALPVDFGWRDIGDWAALYDLMEHDGDGNASSGSQVTLDVTDCLLVSGGKLIAAIGIKDLVVVDTEDVLLVMPRARAQEVKQILARLEERGDDGYL